MMVGLLILLSGLFIWLLFSEKSWIADALDKYAQDEKEYSLGEDIEPNYQEGKPFVKSLDKPFNDPEVPNRPLKKKVKAKTKTKRKYTKRKKK